MLIGSLLLNLWVYYRCCLCLWIVEFVKRWIRWFGEWWTKTWWWRCGWIHVKKEKKLGG